MSDVSPATAANGSSAPAPTTQAGGRRRKGVTMKTLKKVLKKNGLKVSGKKATLRARAKKARLMGGAEEIEKKKEEETKVVETTMEPTETDMEGARRRRRSRSRSRSRGFRLY